MAILLNEQWFDPIKPSSALDQQRWPWPVIVFIFGPLYFLTFVFADAFNLEQVEVFWPANGILLGSLLLNKHARWWLLILTAAICEFFYGFLYSGEAVARSVAFHWANPVECLLAASLIRFVLRRDPHDSMTRRVLYFILLAGVVSASVGAALGTLAVHRVWSDVPLRYVWEELWLSDALGILTIAPFIVTWCALFSDDFRFSRPSTRDVLEYALFWCGLVAVLWSVFGNVPTPPASAADFPYVIIPFILWSVFRFSTRGVTATYLVCACLTIWLTANGGGPFRLVAEEPRMQVLALQTYLFTQFLLMMLVHAALIERSRAEHERAKLAAHFAQTNKMELIGQLAGGIAHDFGNYLAIIQTRSENFILDPKSGPKVKQRADDITAAAERGTALVNRLTSISRNQEGNMELLSLDEVVNSFSGILKQSLRPPHALKVSLHTPEATVRVDREQLERVLLNLVVNARDAMPTGDTILIETGRREFAAGSYAQQAGITPGHYVMLRVADSGIGMNENTLSRAFEPFFTTKETGEGTGLGLASVYGIIKKHDGFIHVRSRPNEGTVIEIYLPREDVAIVDS